MHLQDVHNIFDVGFKLQQLKNRTLGHTTVNGETGRRSIGIAERLSAVVDVGLTPIKHSVSQREPLRQNWYKYLVVDYVKRCTEVQLHQRGHLTIVSGTNEIVVDW